MDLTVATGGKRRDVMFESFIWIVCSSLTAFSGECLGSECGPAVLAWCKPAPAVLKEPAGLDTMAQRTEISVAFMSDHATPAIPFA